MARRWPAVERKAGTRLNTKSPALTKASQPSTPAPDRVVAEDQGVAEVRAPADQQPHHAGQDHDQQRDRGPAA